MSLKSFFTQDTLTVGLVAGLGSEFLAALILCAALAISGIPAAEHLSWFAACFIPPVLILRFYAKRENQPTVTKTLITVLFLSFVAFMFFYLK